MMAIRWFQSSPTPAAAETVIAAGSLPLLLLLIRIYREPKPKKPPEGYRGWPLWFVGAAFIHNRRFGLLFVAGLAVQFAAEAYIL